MTYLLRDFPDPPFKKGDKLIFQDFGPLKSNTFVAILEQNYEFLESVLDIMEIEAPKQEKIPIGDLVINQIISCQWSEDKNWYRALVKQVCLEKKKVKVRFVDFGNSADEPVENIRELPESAVEFPVLGKLVNLDGVESVPIKDVVVKNK